MSDLMREEFEKAIAGMLTKDTGDTVTWLDIMNCRDGDEYKAQTLSSAWWGWQASRDALAVTLPPARDSFSPNIGDDCYCPDQLQAAFEGAGVKVISST